MVETGVDPRLNVPIKFTDLRIASLLFDLNYKFINGSFAFSPGLIFIIGQYAPSRVRFTADLKKEPYVSQILLELWLIGNSFVSSNSVCNHTRDYTNLTPATQPSDFRFC